MSTPTCADDFREMMAAWSKIETTIKTAYPEASAEEVYWMTKAAMDKALGIGFDVEKRLPPAQERRLLEHHLAGASGGKPATYKALVSAGMFETDARGNILVSAKGRAYCDRWHLSIRL